MEVEMPSIAKSALAENREKLQQFKVARPAHFFDKRAHMIEGCDIGSDK